MIQRNNALDKWVKCLWPFETSDRSQLSYNLPHFKKTKKLNINGNVQQYNCKTSYKTVYWFTHIWQMQYWQLYLLVKLQKSDNNEHAIFLWPMIHLCFEVCAIQITGDISARKRLWRKWPESLHIHVFTPNTRPCRAFSTAGCVSPQTCGRWDIHSGGRHTAGTPHGRREKSCSSGDPCTPGSRSESEIIPVHVFHSPI